MRRRSRGTLQRQGSLLRQAARQLLVGIVLMMSVVPASGQPTTSPATPNDSTADEETPSAPAEVDVKPLAEDVDIEDRLRRILEATGRFEDPQVQVQDGVVFLEGRTTKEEFRTWAGDLARKTQDVVAVVNRIEVVEGSMWDLSPAWAEIRRLVREAIQVLPLLGLASVLLVVTWFASKLSARVSEKVFERRMTNRLLRQVESKPGYARRISLRRHTGTEDKDLHRNVLVAGDDSLFIRLQGLGTMDSLESSLLRVSVPPW